MQGTWVQSLVQEDPTCHRATKPMRHNYWAHVLEPMSHSKRSPHIATKRRPCSPQLEKAQARQWRSSAPKNNDKKSLKPQVPFLSSSPDLTHTVANRHMWLLKARTAANVSLKDHGIWPCYCMANRRGKGGNSDRFPLLGLQDHCGQWLQTWNQKKIASWQESDNKPRQRVEKQRPCRQSSLSMIFPVVMYSCESWAIKKAECQRIDDFKLWCWRRLLKVVWTTRRSKQSILREISPEYSLEGLMLKLKLQYFGHLMWIDDSLEKSLMLGKIEGRRRRKHQRMRCLDGIIDSGRWWGTGRPGMLQSMGSQRVRHDWATQQQQGTFKEPQCLGISDPT